MGTQNKKIIKEQQNQIKERQKYVRQLERQIQVLEGSRKAEADIAAAADATKPRLPSKMGALEDVDGDGMLNTKERGLVPKLTAKAFFVVLQQRNIWSRKRSV